MIERELRELAGYASRLDLVQASGGNLSVKAGDDRIFVKASGCTFDDVKKGGGIVEVDGNPAADVTSTLDPRTIEAWDKAVRVRSAGQLRPSMELSFHAVLQRVVLHTHPVAVNGFLCVEGGMARLADALQPVEIRSIRYVMPGVPLGLEIAAAAIERRRARMALESVLLLENHGLVVHGSSVREVLELHDRVVEAAQTMLTAIGASFIVPPGFEPTAIADLHFVDGTVETSVMPAARAACTPLFPDAVVFCGPEVAVATPSPELNQLEADRYVQRWGRRPTIWADRGFLLATGRTLARATAAAEVCWAQETIRALAEQVATTRPLSDLQITELLQSESEQYRHALSDAEPCRL